MDEKLKEQKASFWPPGTLINYCDGCNDQIIGFLNGPFRFDGNIFKGHKIMHEKMVCGACHQMMSDCSIFQGTENRKCRYCKGILPLPKDKNF